MSFSGGRSEEAFVLDSGFLSHRVFDNSWAEGKTRGQGVLNYFGGLQSPASNSLLRSFTFDIQGFASL